MTRRGHRVLAALLLLVAVAVTATTLEARRDEQHRRANPMQGALIDIGGRRLHLQCLGSGHPTVFLLPGAGETSAVWARIAPTVAKTSRACMHDRAGRGWSDPAPAPQDGAALAADLHALLLRAHIDGPVVLVGHSLGGLYARIHAARYPADVAGMVLLDATHAEMFTRVPIYPAIYWAYRGFTTLLPTLARLGVLRAPDATPALARSQRDEWAAIPVVMHQAAATPTLGDLPLVVVTALRDQMEQWLPLQRELVALSSNSVHRVLEHATHMSLLDSAADAAISVKAIVDVIQAVRTGKPLRGP
ncbi:MAG: alpha/beta hydrolase [Gemmatimonadales bacterium]|nr:alpha/beta hydrolase [Gemmatimonadales bacterium]